MDTAVVVLDHRPRSSQPHMIRVRHWNFSPATQFDPKWFERDFLHGVPQVVKHNSPIANARGRSKQLTLANGCIALALFHHKRRIAAQPGHISR